MPLTYGTSFFPATHSLLPCTAQSIIHLLTYPPTYSYSDAFALFPEDKDQAIAAAFSAFQHVRVKHCTDIQLESETYAKNAYGAPRTAAAADTPKEEEKAGGKKEERKLGGYRLVRFALTPFAEALQQQQQQCVEKE